MASRKGRVSTPKVRRGADEISAALRRAKRQLLAAAHRFDEGDQDEAVIMAILLRSLLHFGSSPPLLHHTGDLKRLQFVDSGPDQGRIKHIVSGGLVVWTATIGPDGAAKGQVEPKLDSSAARRRAFTSWWKNDLVIQDGQNRWHTRRFLVTTMANVDGAHFDPFVDTTYDQLTSDNGGWSVAASDHAAVPLSGDIASASVRQVAWETLKTLEDQGD